MEIREKNIEININATTTVDNFENVKAIEKDIQRK